MKKPPENPQNHVIAVLDRWQNPSLVLPLNLVWAGSLYFYFPPYLLLLQGLSVGLGAVVWFLLMSKIRLRGWVIRSSLLDVLGTAAFYFLVQYFLHGMGGLSSHELSTFSWVVYLLQFFCLISAVCATAGYFGRGAIDRFLGLPPASATNGGQLNP